MSETGGPQINLKDLNLNATRTDTGRKDVLGSMVGAAERMGRIGRFESSQFDGVTGGFENAGNILAAEIGIDSAGKEITGFGKFMDKMSKEQFNARRDEILEMNPEQQVDALAGGLDSMKTVVAELIQTRAQAPEFSLPETKKSMKELGEWFGKATKEDQAKVEKFFTEQNAARVDMFAKMKSMWHEQGMVDRANEIRRNADLGMDTSEDDPYHMTRVGGPLRRLAAGIKGFFPRLGKSLASVPVGGHRVERWSSSKNLAKLRSGALADIPENGQLSERHLDMWRMKIVKTDELPSFDVDALIATGAELTAEEQTALRNKKDIGEFKRAPQAEQLKFFTIGYDKTTPSGETKHMEGYYSERAKNAMDTFTKSRDKYLSYSPTNPAWKNALNITGAGLHIIADSDLPFAGLPTLFAELATRGLDYPGRGLMLVAKGAGKGIEFGVDSMEASIAGGALEQLTSMAVGRQEVAIDLSNAIKSGDSDAITKAAMVVRGGETVFAREAMFASRADETVMMTKDKNIAVSTLLAVPEAGRALIEEVTGGIFVGKRTSEVIKDLRDRADLLDGTILLKQVSAESTKLEPSMRVEVEQFFENEVATLKIKDEYRTVESQKTYLEGKWFGKFAEAMRKTMGPDSWIPHKEGGVWDILTEGSARKCVDEIVINLEDKIVEVSAAARVKSTEFLKGVGESTTFTQEQMNSAVEAATLLSVEQANKGYAKGELAQVKRRQQLDGAWAVVGGATVGTVGTVVATLASQYGTGLVDNLETMARSSWGTATTHMVDMKVAADKIITIAQEQGMHVSSASTNVDIFAQWVKTGFFHGATGALDALGQGMTEMKVYGPLIAKVVAFAAITRGALEGVPLRSKLSTKLFKSTAVV